MDDEVDLLISLLKKHCCFPCRAAFMCGREPNFELEEEVKQQLKKLKWDEFLSMTRSAITNKSNYLFSLFYPFTHSATSDNNLC